MARPPGTGHRPGRRERSTWCSGACLLRSSGPATPPCGATWWVNSTQRVIAPAILSPWTRSGSTRSWRWHRRASTRVMA